MLSYFANESGQPIWIVGWHITASEAWMAPRDDVGRGESGVIRNDGEKAVIVEPLGVIIGPGQSWQPGCRIDLPILIRLWDPPEETDWARKLWKRLGLPSTPIKPREVA